MTTPPNADQQLVSVLIATRNRAHSLQRTLRYIAQQETQDLFSYEVLVVDNGSTDATRSVVQQSQEGFPAPLFYMYEGRPGKSYALNCGLRHVRGTVIAFTDDDVAPTKDWLLALYRCFLDESVTAVGGRTLPLWIGPKPAWLTEDMIRRMGGPLGHIDYGDKRLSTFSNQDWEWGGANCAIRREVVRQLGGFDVRMVRAQDTEYFRRCRRAKLQIVYEPNAIVWHKIDAAEVTREFLRNRSHRAGRYHAHMVAWRKPHLATVMPIAWYRLTCHLAWKWTTRMFRDAGHRGQAFSYELLLRARWSAWQERLRLWPRWFLTVVTGRDHLPAAETEVTLTPIAERIKPPLVSVIIATRNRAGYLREAVESVYAQTYGHWELIIVDDGSMDETPEVMKQMTMADSRVRCLRQPHGGVSRARNVGLAVSRGRYVAFLDDDDLFLPSKLEAQVTYLEQHLEVQLLYSAMEAFQGDRVLWVRPKPERFGWTVRDLMWDNFIPMPTVIVRRSCLVEMGGFDPSLREGAEDYDLWLRVAARHPIGYIPKPLARYRWHGTNMSTNAIKSRKATLAVAKRVPVRPELGVTARFKRKCLARHHYILARHYLNDQGAYAEAARHFFSAAVNDPLIGVKMHTRTAKGWRAPLEFSKPYLASAYLAVKGLLNGHVSTTAS